MLVYTTCITFEQADGPQKLVRELARWMGVKGKSFVDPGRLSEGVRDLVLRGGQHVHSRSTGLLSGDIRYPYLFCAQLSHPDELVSGRRWVTEIGLRQESADALIDCTVLLKTDEVSARVVTPIQVTRPRLVADMVEACKPTGDTPGIRTKRLDEESAGAYLSEVEREDRRYPLVVVSSTRSGEFMIAPSRLRSLLVGIAEIVEIPKGVDTFAVQEIAGKRYSAWGGAINIVFPVRRGGSASSCETVLFRPSQLEDMVNEGKNIESEVLAAVTHRTNLPYSRRHISLETVSQARLRAQLAEKIDMAKGAGDVADYVALLEEADRELLAKESDIRKLQLDLDERDSDVRRLQADIDGLKFALSGRQSPHGVTDEEVNALLPLRDAVASVIDGEAPSLSEALTVVSTLFADRLVILDSAHAAAEYSDSCGFRHGRKAFELLWKLAEEYWPALADGRGDQHAKTAFGNNAYAQNEAQTLSTDGKRRRTFSYRGRDIVMEKHLKIGVKDSAAETLRVHFEWISEEKKLVVGHCGKHLDF